MNTQTINKRLDALEKVKTGYLMSPVLYDSKGSYFVNGKQFDEATMQLYLASTDFGIIPFAPIRGVNL